MAAMEKAAADVRERLAAAEDREAKLAKTLEGAKAEVAKLTDEARVHATETAAGRLAQAQVAAATVRHEQADLENTRSKLAETERAAAETKLKLAGAEKRVAELEAKLKSAATGTTASANP
jgi:chromosome segregation ATPase